jgi:Ca2+-transporting ATPase
MAALVKLSTPSVKVRRDGRVQQVSAAQLIPGDVALVEAGSFAPADLRLVESANLRIQEAALTGESEPVDKDADFVAAERLALADRRNMAYMGSTVAYGRGVGLVVATGMETELGQIAEMIQAVEEEATPLSRRLDKLGRALAVAALLIVGVIFLLGVLRGEDLRLLFLTAVSLAVAAVPEGLPAVITIALTLGAQRMLKRNALIRKLPAVETLGSVTVICSDKTGTLTENRMTAELAHVNGRDHPLEALAPLQDDPAVALLLTAGALCNDASLDVGESEAARFRAVGDPTEAALVVAAAQAGLLKPELEDLLPRSAEVPFDSQRKCMSTVHRLDAALAKLPKGLPQALGSAQAIVFAKGAADSLLGVSTQIWAGDGPVPLDQGRRAEILAAHDRLAADGMRVLGAAFRAVEQVPVAAEIERDLVFIGLVAMIDPPRTEVRQAVADCRAAGVRGLMITGDHPLTARHVARQIGLGDSDELLTGADLDRLSAAELDAAIERVDVYARVSPEHKLRLVEALRKHGHIVAMTGDGVNDAPALKSADIGVAMGVSGADVSKQASDMVLQDDNFATIVAAVEEGRIVFDNIRKFIKYLLAANTGELWVMLLGPLLGMPLPLLPLQILWMNLITDGPPALALGFEPGEPHVMRRPPNPPGESVFAGGVARDILWIGLLTALVSLAVGYRFWDADESSWQTMLFTTLSFSQLALALAIRSDRDFLLSIGLLSNTPLLGALGLSFALQLSAVYIPPLQSVFSTTPLTLRELALCVAAGSSSFWVVEGVKRALRPTP